MNFWDWLTQPKPPKPPEYTKLEQELARRIDYLEIELRQEREKYRELVERIAFPTQSSISAPSGPFQSVPIVNRVQAEAQRLSQLSKARLEDQIAEMERRAASISERDEKLSSKANAQEEAEER